MKLLLQNPSAMNGMAEICVDHFPFVIGRASDADRSMPMIFISRYHCKLTLRDGKEVLLEDLESSNGTFVNGKRLTSPTLILHNDEISFGPLAYRVIMQAGSHETSEAQHVAQTNNDMSSTLLVPPRDQPNKQGFA